MSSGKWLDSSLLRVSRAVLPVAAIAIILGPLAAGCGSYGSYSAPSDSWVSSPEAAFGDVEAESGEAASERQMPQSGQLTAGQWSDLDNWDFWISLIRDQSDPNSPTAAGQFAALADSWGYRTNTRIPVRVHLENNPNIPIIDAEVSLLDNHGIVVWRARTDNRGRAELFGNLHGRGGNPTRLIVQTQSQVATVELQHSAYVHPVVVALSQREPVATELDVMLVVDTTGSMGDELSFLQSELVDVLQRVQRSSRQDLHIRTSVNFYRDRGDDYTVRDFPFESDLNVVLDQLADQEYGGGGDYPEAVEAGLINAIYDHDWSPRARARLLFLVLDAPPHQTSQIIEQLHDATAAAAAQGIRIIPIASSGVDSTTECLLRQLAIATAGSYVFLTDHSGVGNSHLEPTIGQFQVERLNDLMVRVINEAVALEPAAVASR